MGGYTRTHLSMMKLPARPRSHASRDSTTDAVFFCRRRRHQVRGRVPRERKSNLKGASQTGEKLAIGDRAITMHSIAPRVLDPREPVFTRARRAAPVESARDDAPIVGGCTSRYRRTRVSDARGAALGASLCEGPASRRAAQLTPLAARS